MHTSVNRDAWIGLLLQRSKQDKYIERRRTMQLTFRHFRSALLYLGFISGICRQPNNNRCLTRQISTYVLKTTRRGDQPSSSRLGEYKVEVVLRHFHRCRYRSSTAVVLLLEGALVSWLLAMREYGGRKDLRGSGRRSVIPYVHGRKELYCCVLVLD
jgi:hypothetical protein